PGMISTAFTRTVVSVALAYVLAFPVGMGSTGVWVALAIGTVLDAIYMGVRWQGKAWLRVALHKTDVYRTYLRHLPEALQQQYLREIRSPFMAQPGAREQVDEDGVLYHLPDGDVRIRFDQDRYHAIS